MAFNPAMEHENEAPAEWTGDDPGAATEGIVTPGRAENAWSPGPLLGDTTEPQPGVETDKTAAYLQAVRLVMGHGPQFGNIVLDVAKWLHAENIDAAETPPEIDGQALMDAIANEDGYKAVQRTDADQGLMYMYLHEGCACSYWCSAEAARADCTVFGCANPSARKILLYRTV